MRFLLDRADETGAATVSATALAQALGLGRASVYRAFDTLEAHGDITREGKTIRINK